MGSGKGIHMIMARARARDGAKINRVCDEVDGRMGSFVNNFSPSAIGWRSPNGPTTLGPLRACI